MLSLLASVPLMCMVRGGESITQGCSIIYLFPASFDCVGFKSHEMRIIELFSFVQYWLSYFSDQHIYIYLYIFSYISVIWLNVCRRHPLGLVATIYPSGEDTANGPLHRLPTSVSIISILSRKCTWKLAVVPFNEFKMQQMFNLRSMCISRFSKTTRTVLQMFSYLDGEV